MEKVDKYPHKLYPCHQGLNITITNPNEAIAKFANVPQFFVYGKQKRAMFHSQSYLDEVEKTNGCACKEHQDSGH